MSPKTLAGPLFVLALVAAPLSRAAAIHTVDSNNPSSADFADVQSAIDAASDGDVIVVRYPYVAPPYDPFVIDGKALTIVGVILGGSGWQAVPPDLVGMPGNQNARKITVRNLGASQQVVLRGMLVDAGNGTLSADFNRGSALTIENCQGAVRVEECSFIGEEGVSGQTFPIPPEAAAAPGVVVRDSDDVAFFGCYVEGGEGAWIHDEDSDWFVTDGETGVEVEGAVLSLYDSRVLGGRGGSIEDTDCTGAGDGGSGMSVTSSKVFLSGSAVLGGDGGHGDYDLFWGCAGAGGDGGDGLVLTSGAVYRLDTTLAGGAQGFDGLGSPSGVPGVPVVQLGGSLLPVPGKARSLTVESPLLGGQGGSIEVGGLPGDSAFLLVSLLPIQTLVPAYSGNLLVGGASFLVPLGTIPASGSLSASFSAPSLGAGTQFAGAYVQVVTQGIDVRLGEGSTALILGHF